MIAHIPTSFIGREQEIAEVARLLGTNRLLTLTGPGGVGKTRLAFVAMEHVQPQFPDGTYIVSLAPIRDPSLVAPAISAALHLPPARDRAPLAGVIALLQEHRVLLVLDNFEQVLTAAPLVAELLTHCPLLSILVTSRAPLHLAAEQEYPVLPLTLPDCGLSVDLNALSQSDAVALFTRRAQQCMPSFALTTANAAAVTEVCRRLDGLPLAIELAAARSKLLSPQELLTRLNQRLALLTGGPLDAPDRQRTMRDTISWSYDLLPTHEQRLFRQLSVFTGGWTLDAAEAVYNGNLEQGSEPVSSIIERLAALLDQNLIRQLHASDSVTRFGMLETIRDFGQEQLVHHEESATAYDRHAAYYVGFAELAGPLLEGSGQALWMSRLAAELDNLRGALSWLRTRADVDQGLRLVGHLRELWFHRGGTAEGLEHTRWFLDLPAIALDMPHRAKALSTAGWLAAFHGDYQESIELSHQSLALFQQLGDRENLPFLHVSLGLASSYSGDRDGADRYWEEGITLAREVGDTRSLSRCLHNLGTHARESGDLDLAAARGEQAYAVASGVNDESCMALALLGMGGVARLRGDLDRAASLYRDSLLLYQSLGNPWGMMETLEGLGLAATMYGNAEQAARLLGMAGVLRDRFAIAPTPGIALVRNSALGDLRVRLGHEAFDAAWSHGRTIMIDELIAEVATAVAIQCRSVPAENPHGMTARELEVLRLIATGHSNRQIAESLFLSPRTVERHIANIYLKIDVHTKAEATTYAQRHHLT